MSVSITHYVVHGVVVTENVKDYFRLTEDAEEYNDNPYSGVIRNTPLGVHIIDDGMNGGYTVAGKILFKSNSGFDIKNMEKIPVFTEDDHQDIRERLKRFDNQFGTAYANKPIKTVVFSHWH